MQRIQHAFQRSEWTDRQDMEPRQQPRQGVDQTSSCLQGPAVRFSLPFRDPSIRQRWWTWSLWTLLQRRMDQPSGPVDPACPPDQSSAPDTRHDSTPWRSATPAITPERRPRTPERFLRTPQRSTRTPDRRVRTPVRWARGCSESRDSRSSSPVSRSSSVEFFPTRDGSPVNFTAAMDPDIKRVFSDDEDDDGDSKKISAARYQIFRQAVTTSKGSFKVNPAKTKRASRASLLDCLLNPTEPERLLWFVSSTSGGDSQRMFIHWNCSFRDIMRSHVSRWIVETVREAYTQADRWYDRVTAHEVRALSALWAYNCQVALPDILSAAFWRSSGVFQNSFSARHGLCCWGHVDTGSSGGCTTRSGSRTSSPPTSIAYTICMQPLLRRS